MTDYRPLSGKAKQAADADATKYKIYEGSVRAGKTVGSLVEWLQYAATGPEGTLLIAGRTQRTVERNIIDPLTEMVGTRHCRLNRGTGVLELLGRRVVVVGAANELARMKIQGLTLAGALVDEAGTLPESFFNMLLSRLSVPDARLWATCNPEGPRHWLKVNYLDRAAAHIDGAGVLHVSPDPDPVDLLRVTFHLDDNARNLDPAYVSGLKNTYRGLWYQRYIEGRWVAAEGAIYDLWDPVKHVVAHDDIPPLERMLACGVDHGMSNASAAVLLGLGVDRRLYVVDEWRTTNTQGVAGMTVAEQAESLRGWLAGYPPPEWVVVDPAAAAMRTELWRQGQSNTIDADNAVTYGIGAVASLLARGRLLVSDRCRWLQEEFPSYVWDPKATEKGEDKPRKVADHQLDALRYAVTTTESLWSHLLDEPEMETA